MATPASSAWADTVEAEEKAVAAGQASEELEELPDKYESELDADGCKTVIEYVKDVRTAERIKVTKKVKVTVKEERIKKAVLDRRTWNKFGDATKPPNSRKPLPEKWLTEYSGSNGFSQEGVTYHPTAQELDFTPKKKSEMKKKPIQADIKPVGVWKSRPRGEPMPSSSGGGILGAAKPSGAYVPPTMRAADGSRRMDLENIRTQRDDSATLRVSNLSDETREEDLQQLFRPFGPITRTYLAKDRNTGYSRGFAFVSFVRREDGQRAMDQLAGFGYDHLILQIEWAKPSAN